jgi:D-3-phosphoglycerate dehydrogenase
MLACERRLIHGDCVTKNGRWKDAVNVVEGARSIAGKTFGFVGFGKIGQKLAPLVAPLGVKLIAYDPYIDLEACKKLNVTSVSLEDVLKNSDYISLHVPLIPATTHMIGEAQFKMMKKETILINTARGGLIDQKALVKALQDHEIAAPGLDVLEAEPPDPNDPIFKLSNVITSGHIGAATKESVERLRAIVAQGVADVLTGKWPEYPGNPAVKEKLNLS